jgi:glycosyltransferase involved in cell wall biosynthesis
MDSQRAASVPAEIDPARYSRMKRAVRPCPILFVNATSEIGGADVDLLEICRHLDRDRVSAVVVLPGRGPLSAQFEAAGARLVYCDTAPIKRFRTLTQAVAYPLRLAVVTVTLWRLIRRERATVVHVNTVVLPAAGYAAKLAGVTCVWHVREIELLQRSRVIGALLRWSIRTCANRVVAISSAVAEGLGGWAQSRTRVIYHGVDTTRFTPDINDRTLREEWSIPSEARVVGYVGRLAPIKGLSYLVTAFAQVHARRADAFLLLVGPILSYHDHVAELRRQVKELDLRECVRFVTECADVPAAIRAMDVVVIPSVVPEGLGLAILESLSCGKPVIATNHGGPVEILRGCAAGRLVPPRDPGAIASAVSDLLDVPDVRRRALSAEARRWVLRYFSVERMIAELMGVYEMAGP